MEGFRRTAYLLTGDWHAADDIVSAALARLYTHWHRVSRVENVVANVLGILDGTVVRIDRLGGGLDGCITPASTIIMT
jgi:DNA-directed RNA polymerase specialized sigma24 family protein